MILMWIYATASMTVFNNLSSPAPRKSILRGPRWGTVFSTTVMGRKVSDLQPMYTSLINMNNFVNRKRSNRVTRKSTNPIWVMGWRVASL